MLTPAGLRGNLSGGGDDTELLRFQTKLQRHGKDGCVFDHKGSCGLPLLVGDFHGNFVGAPGDVGERELSVQRSRSCVVTTSRSLVHFDYCRSHGLARIITQHAVPGRSGNRSDNWSREQHHAEAKNTNPVSQIGKASCTERAEIPAVAATTTYAT